MDEILERTELLLGHEAIQELKSKTVAVFGIGGVGGYVTEALARSGVGCLHLIDNDVVSISNCNRQIIATLDTVGQSKTSVAAARIHSINPEIQVICHDCFYLPETADQFDFSQYDYVVDAIDTVAGKISLILEAQAVGTPIISSMGTGNKLDPSKLKIADIYKTSVCPLARIMRKELRKRNVKALKVVYSTEPPIRSANADAQTTVEGAPRRKAVPGSTAFVPAVAGLLIAAEIVKELTEPVWPDSIRNIESF